MKEKKFEVQVCRTYYAFGSITVSATSKKAAEKIALESIENFTIKDIGTDEIVTTTEIEGN